MLGLMGLITTLILNYFALSFLGLYGTFILGCVGLGCVLLGLLLTFPAVMLKGVVAHSTLFK